MADESNGRPAKERFVVVPDTEPEVRLRLTISSVKAAERRSRMAFSQLWALSHAFAFDAMTHLLWAGLQWENPKATESTADKLLADIIEGGRDLNDVSELIDEMVDRAGFLRKKEGGPPTPGAPETPTTPETEGAPEPVVSSPSPNG